MDGNVLVDEKDALKNTILLPPAPPAETEVSLYTVNDILLHRIQHSPEAPLRKTDRFANGAVQTLQVSGLPKFSDPVENRVVAILGPSNLDYIVFLFALSRLGYAVLLLSTRLSTEAYINLLTKTNCNRIVYSSTTENAASSIRDQVPKVIELPIPEYSVYPKSTELSVLQATGQPEMGRKWAFIIHSSGSTGLPTLIFQTHAACIANYGTSNSYRGLLTLSLYHNHGSSCPDDLGNLLVDKGVRLISHYGATELGQLMTSDRPAGDKLWNYVRPLKGSQPYLRMGVLEDGSYECIVLDGLPSKVSSNCDDPPNSFRTRDTFLKHPNLPNAWKYLGRIDDRVTLVNGEKVLPVPIEHRIRQSKFVKDNLVFGVGKPLPGLLIVPSAECQNMAKDEILNIVWPDIEAANKKSEAFSQISRDMVIVLAVGCTYPATDKGTMIRNRSYKKFSDLIEDAYQRLEEEKYLLVLFRADLGFTGLGSDSGFFEAGVDSLQAIKARGIIKKDLDIGSSKLGHKVVFDFANIRKLAAHLHALHPGDQQDEEDELAVMSRLVDKYSCFVTRAQSDEAILLTGTTGSLGVYILSRLMQKVNVKRIYCLVQASNPSNALDRILSNLASRLLPMVNVSKIVALPSQLGSEDLGLSPSILSELPFEAQHIKSVYNLINLCLSSNRSSPAQFYFCSSISAAAGTPLPASIAEAPIPELAHAQGMGYARSKLVAERVVQAAAERTGIVAKVLRVGQIVGDTVNGKWNNTEAIPLMLQTAQTLKALPALDETPSWLPVDIVADAVLDLTGLNDTSTSGSQVLRCFSLDPDTVYHVQNVRTFKWTEELLPALKKAGLDFETLTKRQWKYDNDNLGRSGLTFEMEKSEAASPTLKGGVELIESGLVKKFVDAWRSEW
ncbi:hypothetical protein BDW62DRAFT_210450 [Aspergillus aurantiobrunneus]